MNFRVTEDKTGDVLKAIKDLTKRTVLVGIPDTNAARDPEPGENSPATNAQLGYIHEFGSPVNNIPARPFLVPGVESARDQIVAQMKKGGIAALAGDLKQVEKTQIASGLIAVNAVQAKITDGPFQPLAPATLAARRAKGRTGESPLLDSGQLRRAVTYVIREKGK